MKLKTGILLVFSFFAFYASSQTTFNIAFKFPETQIFRDMIELQNENLVLIGTSHDRNNPPYNNSYGFLYEIEPDGDTAIFSYRFGDTAVSLHSIIELNDGNLLAAGSICPPPYEEFKLFSMLLDTSYAVISKHILIDSAFIKVDADFLIKNSSTIFLLGKIDYFDNIFLKLDFTGMMISISYNPNRRPHPFEDVLFNSDSSKLWIFGSGYNGEDRAARLEIDTTFSIYSLSELPDGYNLNELALRWSSENSLYQVGSYYDPFGTGDRQISLKLVDTTFNAISSTVFFGNDSTPDCAAFQGGLDFLNPDSVFIFGTMDNAGAFYPEYYNTLLFASVDSNLNVLSQNYLGGDAYYQAEKILQCSDGNLVCVGTSYDYLTNYYEYDIVVWKLNQQGLLTNLNETFATKSEDIRVSPNPGSDFLEIIFPKSGGILEIYSIEGSLKFSSSIYNERMRVNTRNFSQGIYILKYVSKEGQSSTIKWIKK